MFVVIAIVASFLLSFIYFAWLGAFVELHGKYHVDSAKFKALMRSQLFSGNPQGAVKVSASMPDAVLAKWTKALLINHKKVNELDNYVSQGSSEAQLRINELNRPRSLRGMLFHSFCFGALGLILYSDGMQTGWVIGPITLAYLWMGFMILNARHLRSEAIKSLENVAVDLYEMKEAVVQADGKNLFAA